MVSVGQVFDVIDSIAAPATRREEVAAAMRKGFCAGAGNPGTDRDAELSVNAVIGGLRDAVYAGVIGLWVDHNEPFAINDQARALIDTHVGVANPNTAAYYNYDGEDVAEGILGFDKWLQADHQTHREQRIKDGDSPEQVDKTRDNLRLIEIETGADYYLSILHPNNNIDTLIKALTTINLHAARPTAPAPPPKLDFERYNIGELIWEHLTTHHGYQDRSKLVGTQLTGSLTRVVDEQHAITAVIQPFKKGPSEGSSGRLHFAISRADINQLGQELGFKAFSSYTLTVQEADYSGFLQRPLTYWSNHLHTPQDVIDYLDEWIPQLDTICNLEFIEAHLPTIHPDGRVLNDYEWLAMTLNQMLNGADLETHEALLSDRIAMIVNATTPESKRRTRVEARVIKIREWLAANPTGRRHHV